VESLRLACFDAIATLLSLASTVIFFRGVWQWGCRSTGLSTPERSAGGSTDFKQGELPLTIAVSIVFGWALIVVSVQMLWIIGLIVDQPLLGGWSLHCLLLGWGLLMLHQYGCSSRIDFSKLIAIRDRFYWVFASLLLGHVVNSGLLQYPSDWDSLAYHLPIIDHWVQTGDLFNQRCAFWYVPGNHELIGFWLVAPQTGDYLAGISGVPVAALMLASSISILNHFGVTQWPARIAIVSLGASSVFLRQTVDQENDLAVAALMQTVIALALSQTRADARLWRRSWLASPIVAMAICIGLLAGTKYYALGYAVVASFVVVTVVLARYGQWACARLIGSIVLGCLMLASIWYLRNWTLAGSPVFPKGFERLGIDDLWQDMRPGNEYSSLWGGGTREVWSKLAWAWLSQTGPATTLLLLGGMFWSVCSGCQQAFIRFRNRDHFDFSLTIMSFATIAATAVYVVTPNVIETVHGTHNMLDMGYTSVRFGFSTAALATITSAVAVARLFLRMRQIAIYFLVMLLAMDVLIQGVVVTGLERWLQNGGWQAYVLGIQAAPPLIDWFLATLISTAAGLLMWRTICVNNRSGICLAGACCVVISAALSYAWHKHYDSFYLHVMKLPVQDETLKEGGLATVGSVEPVAAFCYRYYPLLGSDRRNHVIRPLYLPKQQDVIDFLDRFAVSHAFLRRPDNHWTASYRAVNELIDERPEAFAIERVTPSHCRIEIEKNCIRPLNRSECTSSVDRSKIGQNFGLR
jgi:hypothetical protein